MIDNQLICSGDACPLRFTCLRWQNWLNNEDDDANEMSPDYHPDCRGYFCKDYTQKEYYGQ